MSVVLTATSCGITGQRVLQEIDEALRELKITKEFQRLENAVKKMVFPTLTEGIKWCWEQCKEFATSHPIATCFAVFIVLVLAVAAGGVHTIVPLKEIFSEVASTLWAGGVKALNEKGLSAVTAALMEGT